VLDCSPRDGPRARSDADWGRIAAARPPLSPRAPLVWFTVSAAVLAVVVIGVVGGPGPLDDPDEGDQRPGLLIDPDEAMRVEGLALPGDPIGRRPVVIVFDRQPPERSALATFVDELPQSAEVLLVMPAAERPAVGERADAVADPAGRIAGAVGMPRPQDGGYPVGYAVVDRRARVRYATLDPEYLEHGFEVDIVVGALT
jgi:hypothetical protein